MDALKNLSLDASHARRIGFLLSHQLILREWILVQDTIDAAMYALLCGVSLMVNKIAIIDLDIELEDGTTHKVNLNLLENSLNNIFEKIKPDFVFYLAGVNILFTDKLGKLKISKEACLRSDALVFEHYKMYKVSVAVAMGGGY